MKGHAFFPGKIMTKKGEKSIDEILKIFFSRTTGPISTKLGTKYAWVKGESRGYSKWPCPFPRGDNYEIAKIH